MAATQEQIDLVHSLRNCGWSHRGIAERLQLSIRQIQKAIDPWMRQQLDRDYHRARLRRARKSNGKWVRIA